MLQDAKEQEEGGFLVQWRRKHFKSGWENNKKKLKMKLKDFLYLCKEENI